MIAGEILMRPKEIGIVGFENVAASQLSLPADAFAAAFLEDGFGGRIPCYKVWILGLTKESFSAESGLTLRAQRTLDDTPPLDTIIIPGGSGLRQPLLNARLAEWILSRAYETRRIASICTGLYALAPTGLLDGREVTTHWRAAGEIGRRHPTLRIDHRRGLVKDGPFYTSAGVTAGIDLALALIEEDYGKQVALAVGRDLMLYLATKNEPDNIRRLSEYESRPIDRFGELVAWILRHLEQDLTVELLARRAGMCPSHFNRAFKSVFGSTPGDFIENLRVNEARRRLSSRGKTVRSVAASVGFSSSTAFRRAFQRRFGTGPADSLLGQKVPAVIGANAEERVAH
jgi:transcriptional regulator GlxA family with amidase domain